MVRELMHDPFFLGIKSKPATKDDSLIAFDLLDTLNAHRETCVGIKAAPYETEEGCLSLLGSPRKTTRYKTIKVKYQDDQFQWKNKSYSGFTAQIIQHEIDHCNGVLI